MIRYKYILIAMLALTAGINAQAIRTAGMGGLGYSITDEDNSLTPYDFGGNPAWLMNDQKQDWLKFIPSADNTWGDYKRRYDPSRTNSYNALFRGIKVLEDGTFLGETTYEYELRRKVPHSLKYNTYNGEAFFMNDSTTGNIRYMGPSMKFMYSFEPVDNLFAGASASYRLLNGLKNIYSRAEILYRNVFVNAGIAYRFSDSFIAGLTVSYMDEQEKIESKSEDLLDVDIFNYIGDTYYTFKRASSVLDKFTQSTTSAGLQLYYTPSSKFEIALSGEAAKANNRLLIPYYSNDVSYKEYESGYASFNNYVCELAARYRLTDMITLSAEGGYYERKSWSKNSSLDLLLWEWDQKSISGSVGASVKLTDGVLLGAEYRYSSNSSDSSKYADSRYFDETSGDNLIIAGCEAEVMKNIFVRAGYNYGTKEIDFVYGGRDIKVSRFTFGMGLHMFETFSIDFLLAYNNNEYGDFDINRAGLNSCLSLKLMSF